MSGGEERRRTIKLYCPSLSKLVPFVAWEEQRLDLGSIARTFGIEPATLKLNGHFISRGVDLISSSVTWKSLLSFFSARGLSTGKDDGDALIVDGKLCKAGSKRSHDPQDVGNGICDIAEGGDVGVTRRPQLEAIDLIKKKKLTKSASGSEDGNPHVTTSSGLGFKRKQELEDVSPLKKLKMNETKLDASPRDFDGSTNDLNGSFPNTQFPCSYMSENAKRTRGDEVFMATSSKRIRY
ncbi:hypothetical protein L1049_004321 [Liquidambar formosana]|uniref:Uncharacterized protein n=1 Tax=Liquidambar formosana TaxID=63359 RepID=A0AAP0RSP8_LIQFO